MSSGFVLILKLKKGPAYEQVPFSLLLTISYRTMSDNKNIPAIVQAILSDFVEQGKTSFYIKDEAPVLNKYPQKGQAGVLFNNTGMGILDCPRNGAKTSEYSGVVFASNYTVDDDDPLRFLKVPILVAIPGDLNIQLIGDIDMFESLPDNGHRDIALSNCHVIIKENESGLFRLVLDRPDWEVIEAWTVETSEFRPKNGQSVAKAVDGRVVRSFEDQRAITTILFGDIEIYDSRVVVPQKGPIVFKKQPYSSLDKLFEALVDSKNFMRIMRETSLDVFLGRCDILADAMGELASFRDDWNGLIPDVVDRAALRNLEVMKKSIAPPVVVPATITRTTTPAPVTTTPQPTSIFRRVFGG